MGEMLELKQEHFISRGLHRECYWHPRDSSRCIKVVVNGDDSESARETRYYRLLGKRRIDWSMLPRFFGVVPTNKGPGYQFEVVRDYTGEVSDTLEVYLESPERTAALIEPISTALLALYDYLMDNGIVTMTLKPKNILFRRKTETAGDMVIVDNIGNSDFIPLCNYSPFFARRKTRRKWERFQQMLAKQFPTNPHLPLILQKLRQAG